MGRYDGEDYPDKGAPCYGGLEVHDFAMNGTCFKCRWTRGELIKLAKLILGRV